MPLADYAHWNEEAERIWWEEEGRHAAEPEYDPDDYLDHVGPMDAFAEEIAEVDEADAGPLQGRARRDREGG